MEYMISIRESVVLLRRVGSDEVIRYEPHWIDRSVIWTDNRFFNLINIYTRTRRDIDKPLN